MQVKIDRNVLFLDFSPPSLAGITPSERPLSPKAVLATKSGNTSPTATINSTPGIDFSTVVVKKTSDFELENKLKEMRQIERAKFSLTAEDAAKRVQEEAEFEDMMEEIEEIVGESEEDTEYTEEEEEIEENIEIGESGEKNKRIFFCVDGGFYF